MSEPGFEILDEDPRKELAKRSDLDLAFPRAQLGLHLVATLLVLYRRVAKRIHTEQRFAWARRFFPVR